MSNTLPNVRIGSDVTIKARLKDAGVAIDWTGVTGVKACVYSDAQNAVSGRCACTVDENDHTLLLCEYAAQQPQYVGACRLILTCEYFGKTKTFDEPAFNFVEWTDEADGPELDVTGEE